MSSNRLKYDRCASLESARMSQTPSEYILDPIRFENENKCRNEFGLLGGTNVSHIAGNMVDLESDLMGITRPATQCPSLKYSKPKGNVIMPKNYMKFADVPKIDTSLKHLDSCQMINYPPLETPSVPLNPSCRLSK